MSKRGMYVHVLRSTLLAGRHGVSNHFDTLVLIGDEIPGVVEASPDTPAVCLVMSETAGRIVVPTKGHQEWFHESGNYVISQGDWPFLGPLPVYDQEKELHYASDVIHYLLDVETQARGSVLHPIRMVIEVPLTASKAVAGSIVAKRLIEGTKKVGPMSWVSEIGLTAEIMSFRVIPFQEYRILKASMVSLVIEQDEIEAEEMGAGEEKEGV